MHANKSGLVAAQEPAMGAINAPGHVRELVISQRHIHRRDLRRLLNPTDRLREGDLSVEVLQGEASVHEQRRVRVPGRDTIYADALLDNLGRHTADEAAQRGLGGRVGDRALQRDQARNGVGDDDRGPRRQQRRRGADDVEVRVDVHLHDVVPDFRRRLGDGLSWTDGAVVVPTRSVRGQEPGQS